MQQSRLLWLLYQKSQHRDGHTCLMKTDFFRISGYAALCWNSSFQQNKPTVNSRHKPNLPARQEKFGLRFHSSNYKRFLTQLIILCLPGGETLCPLSQEIIKKMITTVYFSTRRRKHTHEAVNFHPLHRVLCKNYPEPFCCMLLIKCNALEDSRL